MVFATAARHDQALARRQNAIGAPDYRGVPGAPISGRHGSTRVEPVDQMTNRRWTLPGLERVTRDGLPGLFAAHEQIWHW